MDKIAQRVAQRYKAAVRNPFTPDEMAKLKELGCKFDVRGGDAYYSTNTRPNGPRTKEVLKDGKQLTYPQAKALLKTAK